MYFIKRCFFLTLMILFIISIYKDLSNGTFIESKMFVKEQNEQQTDYKHDFTIVKVKVTAGDTALSIIEKINEKNLSEIDIIKFLEDFKQINPQVDPNALANNTYYYFPVYKY